MQTAGGRKWGPKLEQISFIEMVEYFAAVLSLHISR